MHLKLIKKTIQKEVEENGDLIEIKLLIKFKNLKKIHYKILTVESEIEKPKGRYISPEERQKIIDNVRLI